MTKEAFSDSLSSQAYPRTDRGVGEVATLSGEVALVEVRAKEDSEVLAVPPESLRRIIVENSDLSDIILHSFVLRRARLIERGEGFFRIIGSRFSQDTFRIREFFVRNGYPVTKLCAKTVVIASGAEYRRPEVPGCREFVGGPGGRSSV